MVWNTVDIPVEDAFENLKPGRRQFYANFVVIGNSCTLNDGERAKDRSQNLERIVFPKMASLRMFFDGDGEKGERSLPRLNCPNLRRMTFQDMDIENEEKGDDMGADQWESIFWDISTKYPSLKELEFLQYTPRVFPRAIRRLKRRHPNLRDSLKKLNVHETNICVGHDYTEY